MDKKREFELQIFDIVKKIEKLDKDEAEATFSILKFLMVDFPEIVCPNGIEDLYDLYMRDNGILETLSTIIVDNRFNKLCTDFVMKSSIFLKIKNNDLFKQLDDQSTYYSAFFNIYTLLRLYNSHNSYLSELCMVLLPPVFSLDTANKDENKKLVELYTSLIDQLFQKGIPNRYWNTIPFFKKVYINMFDVMQNGPSEYDELVKKIDRIIQLYPFFDGNHDFYHVIDYLFFKEEKAIDSYNIFFPALMRHECFDYFVQLVEKHFGYESANHSGVLSVADDVLLRISRIHYEFFGNRSGDFFSTYMDIIFNSDTMREFDNRLKALEACYNAWHTDPTFSSNLVISIISNDEFKEKYNGLNISYDNFQVPADKPDNLLEKTSVLYEQLFDPSMSLKEYYASHSELSSINELVASYCDFVGGKVKDITSSVDVEEIVKRQIAETMVEEKSIEQPIEKPVSESVGKVKTKGSFFSRKKNSNENKDN